MRQAPPATPSFSQRPILLSQRRIGGRSAPRPPGPVAAALRSLRPASLTPCRSRKNGSPLASRRTRPAVKCGLGRELRLKTRSTAGFAVSSNQFLSHLPVDRRSQFLAAAAVGRWDKN